MNAGIAAHWLIFGVGKAEGTSGADSDVGEGDGARVATEGVPLGAATGVASGDELGVAPHPASISAIAAIDSPRDMFGRLTTRLYSDVLLSGRTAF